MINKNGQYKKQLEYFGNEFGKIENYSLAPWQKSYIDRIKKDMLGKSFKGKTLLDVATGSGYVAVEMAKLGLKVIATDLTPEALANINEYKKKFSLKNIKTIECFAEKIPLPDSSVDYLVANAILEHIPDEKQVVREWKRILKPGGKMFITVPLKFRYIWPFLWIPNFLHDKKIGHLRRYDIKSLETVFDLKSNRTFYSGHLTKVFGILLSVLLKNSKYDSYFEKKDRELEKKVYGANNVSIIFMK